MKFLVCTNIVLVQFFPLSIIYIQTYSLAL